MMNSANKDDNSSKDVDGDNENVIRPVYFWTARPLLKMIDSCFNFFLFGMSNDVDTRSPNHHSNIVDESTDRTNAAVNQEQLRVARCKLLLIPSTCGHSFFDPSSMKRSYNQITHCQQEDIWDCGVTCIMMLIRFLKNLEYLDTSFDNRSEIRSLCRSLKLTQKEKLQKQWMLDKLNTESIWTIDLVMLLESILNGEAPSSFDFPERHLLNGSKVSYLYCSNNLGVDKTYEGLSYYKHAFGDDNQRVTSLFSVALQNKIPMLKISHINIDFVAETVSTNNCIAIVLLDYSILCNKHLSNKDKSEETLNSSLTEFSGHYVILSGISTNENDIAKAKQFGYVQDLSYCMVLINPGCKDHISFVGKELFELSWKAKGTDCDILFIAVNKINDGE